MAKFNLMTAGYGVPSFKKYPELKALKGFKVDETEEIPVTEALSKEELIRYLKSDKNHSVGDTLTEEVSCSFETEDLNDLKHLAAACGNHSLVVNFKDQSIIIYDDYME